MFHTIDVKQSKVNQCNTKGNDASLKVKTSELEKANVVEQAQLINKLNSKPPEGKRPQHIRIQNITLAKKVHEIVANNIHKLKPQAENPTSLLDKDKNADIKMNYKNLNKTDDARSHIEECRRPMLKIPIDLKADLINDKRRFSRQDRKKEDCDTVLIGSHKNSQSMLQQNSSQSPRIDNEKKKISKKIELSPYEIKHSPFSELIDESICEYLGNQSLYSKCNKTSNF